MNLSISSSQPYWSTTEYFLRRLFAGKFHSRCLGHIFVCFQFCVVLSVCMIFWLPTNSVLSKFWSWERLNSFYTNKAPCFPVLFNVLSNLSSSAHRFYCTSAYILENYCFPPGSKMVPFIRNCWMSLERLKYSSIISHVRPLEKIWS